MRLLKTSTDANAPVELVYIIYEHNITVTLQKEEADQVRRILDGKTYDPIGWGVTACGFDENVSLRVGNRTYAIAMDTCNSILDMGSLRYFSVSQEEIDYIHALFQKHGGGFPCM